MHNQDELRKSIKEGLTQTINEHGPITKRLIGSAIKRIIGSLKPNLNSNPRNNNPNYNKHNDHKQGK